MTRVLALAASVAALAALAALAWRESTLDDRVAALEARASKPEAQPADSRANARSRVRFDDDLAAAPRAEVPIAAAPREAARAADSSARDDRANASAVSGIVRDELKKVDDERQQRREDRQRARVQHQVDGLNIVDADKRAKLVEMLQAELVEIRQAMEDARDAEDSGTAAPAQDPREQMRAIRKKTDDNAMALMNDDE
ncbi:MAG TPA: hypothetical protein VGO62_03375, partial [Myxococcota bacterium]